MKILPSRLSTLWYALQTGTEEERDEYGHYTGRFKPIYSAPLQYSLMISPANASTRLEQTGLQEADTRKMITNDANLEWDNTTILWIDKEPYINGNLQPHNYVVESVQKSLFAVGIVARRVILGNEAVNQRNER